MGHMDFFLVKLLCGLGVGQVVMRSKFETQPKLPHDLNVVDLYDVIHLESAVGRVETRVLTHTHTLERAV